MLLFLWVCILEQFTSTRELQVKWTFPITPQERQDVTPQYYSQWRLGRDFYSYTGL